MAGPTVPLNSLPSIAGDDMALELDRLAIGLAAKGHTLLTVDTTHPELGLAANYSFVPGFAFRERTPAASLGLFTGRVLAEQADPDTADAGLARLAEIYPNAPFVPFFEGLLSLRLGDPLAAVAQFACAESLQPPGPRIRPWRPSIRLMPCPAWGAGTRWRPRWSGP